MLSDATLRTYFQQQQLLRQDTLCVLSANRFYSDTILHQKEGQSNHTPAKKDIQCSYKEQNILLDGSIIADFLKLYEYREGIEGLEHTRL